MGEYMHHFLKIFFIYKVLFGKLCFILFLGIGFIYLFIFYFQCCLIYLLADQ